MTSQYHLPLRLRIQPSPLLLLDMLLPFPSNNVFRATIVAQPNRQEKPHFSPKLTDITQSKTPPEKVQKTQRTIRFHGKIKLKSIRKFFMNEYDFSFYHNKTLGGLHDSPRVSFHAIGQAERICLVIKQFKYTVNDTSTVFHKCFFPRSLKLKYSFFIGLFQILHQAVTIGNLCANIR